MQSSGTIYADYQATTPVDVRVLGIMAPLWSEEFGNPHSSDHVVGWHAAERVSDSAAAVANLIGADADEVVFTSGATEANNLALLGLARRAPASRRRILVSAIEHKCVLSAARTLQRREGFSVETVPVDREGFVQLDVLEEMLDETVLVASIMAVNNEIGTIQDVPAVARLLHRFGAVFHCDAAQAPCAMDVSDLATHADLVSLSGHKMYGPKGIGSLFVRRELADRIEPLVYGGGQQGMLRSGTVPVPLCVGMAGAASILRGEEGRLDRERVSRLRDMFLRSIQSLPFDVTLNGPPGETRHPGNANLRFHGFSAQDVLSALQPRLAASTGAACSSGMPEPSHVLLAIGLSPREASASIRFSFGRLTNRQEVVGAQGLLRRALAGLRFLES